jgi:hypothetical protein
MPVFLLSGREVLRDARGPDVLGQLERRLGLSREYLELVPAGEDATVLVRLPAVRDEITASFRMDFARNPIVEAWRGAHACRVWRLPQLAARLCWEEEGLLGLPTPTGVEEGKLHWRARLFACPAGVCRGAAPSQCLWRGSWWHEEGNLRASVRFVIVRDGRGLLVERQEAGRVWQYELQAESP